MAYSAAVRAKLSFLIACSLLFQSALFAHASTPPCPMDESGLAAPMASGHDECCNDALTGTDEPCESWSECPLVQSVVLLPAMGGDVTARAEALGAAPSLLPVLARIDTIWRPPSRS